MPAPDRRQLAAVIVGGACGSLLRVALERAFPAAAGSWPWATLAINLSGTFALAHVAVRLRTASPSGWVRQLLGTGFCGAFTTFSTMQLELLKMLDHGRYGLGCAYALASLLGGYAAIHTGHALGPPDREIA